MVIIGLMIAMFASETYNFMQFQKTSEIMIDVNAGVEKVRFLCDPKSSSNVA